MYDAKWKICRKGWNYSKLNGRYIVIKLTCNIVFGGGNERGIISIFIFYCLTGFSNEVIYFSVVVTDKSGAGFTYVSLK